MDYHGQISEPDDDALQRHCSNYRVRLGLKV